MASRSAANAARPIVVKMIVNAGQAAPSPPVGPALGSKGVKAIDFCKQFNAITANLQVGLPIPITVTIRPADRSFTFKTTSPQASFLLMRCAGAVKGATTYDGQWSSTSTPQGQPVGTISLKHIYHLAQIKSSDPQLQATSLKNICRMLIGTANSVGVKVVP